MGGKQTHTHLFIVGDRFDLLFEQRIGLFVHELHRFARRHQRHVAHCCRRQREAGCRAGSGPSQAAARCEQRKQRWVLRLCGRSRGDHRRGCRRLVGHRCNVPVRTQRLQPITQESGSDRRCRRTGWWLTHKPHQPLASGSVSWPASFGLVCTGSGTSERRGTTERTGQTDLRVPESSIFG